MIFVSVGTFLYGFDELISAVDLFCGQTGQAAFAQIGNSSVIPQHMGYERFLTAEKMQQKMLAADLIVCHAGFGVLGDAMRANRSIIAVPRQNLRNSSGIPANNQLVVAQRLSELYKISVCVDLQNLPRMINEAIAAPHSIGNYVLRCNIPSLIADFLEKNL